MSFIRCGSPAVLGDAALLSGKVRDRVCLDVIKRPGWEKYLSSKELPALFMLLLDDLLQSHRDHHPAFTARRF